jgi:pilus assembly protein Flp/PilA
LQNVLDFLRSEEGASAAEYALILAIIGTAIALSCLVLGGTISNAVAKTANCIASTSGCP